MCLMWNIDFRFNSAVARDFWFPSNVIVKFYNLFSMQRLDYGWLKHYTEPENIRKLKVQSEMEERCANDSLEEFGPADDFKASQQTDAEVDVWEYVTCMN